MKEEDVKKVIEIIKKDPLDDFWGDYDEDIGRDSNAYLFNDIVEMVKKAGYELQLIRK